jgi:hypothetical protein
MNPKSPTLKSPHRQPSTTVHQLILTTFRTMSFHPQFSIKNKPRAAFKFCVNYLTQAYRTHFIATMLTHAKQCVRSGILSLTHNGKQRRYKRSSSLWHRIIIESTYRKPKERHEADGEWIERKFVKFQFLKRVFCS